MPLRDAAFVADDLSLIAVFISLTLSLILLFFR